MKDILKEIKLNESVISMALGALVVLIVGFFVVQQFRLSETPDFSVTTDTSVEDIQQPSEPIASEPQADTSGNQYVVVAGDNLWNISEREYGTGYEWKKIAEANPEIASTGEIEEGQTITIPSATEVSTDGDILDEGVATAVDQPVSNATTSNLTEYTVQRGDNLWNIAESMLGDGYRWVEIASMNELANPHIIHSGNILRLPS